MLWAATETGTAITEITSLDLLIRPDVAQRILEWHFSLMGHQTPSAGLVGFLDALTAIAASKGLVGPQALALKRLLRAARPKQQTEMSDKNAGLVTSLEQQQPRRLLLHRPFVLMAEARRLRDGYTDKLGVHHSPAPLRGSWLAAVAVAIEIELHLPLRVRDLASLDINRDLTRLDKGHPNARWRLALQASKNGMRVETELTQDSAALMSEYVDVFRPLGPHPGSQWLFPHRDGASRPRPEGHFSEAISEQVQRQTGVDMNIHVFRSFAALLIVERDPHALEDIRAILGHKSFDTAWRHYMRQNRLASAARLGATIREVRRDLGGRR